MLNKELVIKKINQIQNLITELKGFLSVQFDTFIKDTKTIRSSERNFQLIVDLAIDINTQLIVEKTTNVPDTYRLSFVQLGELDVLPKNLAKELSLTASLRNILIHEYDFEEDHKKFYDSALQSIPNYEEYCQLIYNYLSKKD